MAYAAWSVIAGEQPTTSKWNILGTNDSSFNDGSGIADSAILPKHLLTGTGSSWPWASWTPSWTNLVTGNGTLTYAKYAQIGKSIFARLNFVLGSTSSVSGVIIVTLPKLPNADLDQQSSLQGILSNVRMIHSATSIFGMLAFNSGATTSVAIQAFVASGTATSVQNTSATAPFTWATGDSISLSLAYEAA